MIITTGGTGQKAWWRNPMRAVVQRVSEAAVRIDGDVVGSIGSGLLVYVSVASDDCESDVTYLADKILHLRIFPDADDRLNLNVQQAGGGLLIVSAFTVHADARRGRRPSFESAASHEDAKQWYERFCELVARQGVAVERGVFGATMAVTSTNAGPVCILLDSKRLF